MRVIGKISRRAAQLFAGRQQIPKKFANPYYTEGKGTCAKLCGCYHTAQNVRSTLNLNVPNSQVANQNPSGILLRRDFIRTIFVGVAMATLGRSRWMQYLIGEAKAAD